MQRLPPNATPAGEQDHRPRPVLVPTGPPESSPACQCREIADIGPSPAGTAEPAANGFRGGTSVRVPDSAVPAGRDGTLARPIKASGARRAGGRFPGRPLLIHALH
jgi:hypothetical protein